MGRGLAVSPQSPERYGNRYEKVCLPEGRVALRKVRARYHIATSVVTNLHGV
jgi:hypothetical protein